MDQYLTVAVITSQPEELMSKWIDMIPGGRTCKPQELKGVSILRSFRSICSRLMLGLDLYVPSQRCLQLHDRLQLDYRCRLHPALELTSCNV